MSQECIDAKLGKRVIEEPMKIASLEDYERKMAAIINESAE